MFYQLSLFLFHSPLLKKSWLFSFPSLIDMLKLRESSYIFQIIIFFFFDMFIINLLLYYYHIYLYNFVIYNKIFYIVSFFNNNIEIYIYQYIVLIDCHAFK